MTDLAATGPRSQVQVLTLPRPHSLFLTYVSCAPRDSPVPLDTCLPRAPYPPHDHWGFLRLALIINVNNTLSCLPCPHPSTRTMPDSFPSEPMSPCFSRMHQIAFSSIKTAAIPIRPSLVPISPMFSFTTALFHSTADRHVPHAGRPLRATPRFFSLFLFFLFFLSAPHPRQCRRPCSGMGQVAHPGGLLRQRLLARLRHVAPS